MRTIYLCQHINEPSQAAVQIVNERHTTCYCDGCKQWLTEQLQEASPTVTTEIRMVIDASTDA